MPALFEYPHAVLPDEIDGLGHVNNVAYVEWMQRAALAHSTAEGWSAEAHQKLGTGWVVRSHQIEYLQPALPGDEIIVRTWVADMKKATSTRQYRIVRKSDGVLLATAATKWAYVNYATGMPTRVPREIAEAFEAMGSDVPPA
jgi:acyl-CoA thioester hydrolase